LSNRDWQTAARLFSFRGGASGRDVARFFGWNEKTGQRLNRIFRSLVIPLEPSMLPGSSEWDEAVPLRAQWVAGGVSRTDGQCLLSCIPNRSEDVLTSLVEHHTDPEGTIFTDEHGGYCGLLNRMSVCHTREFVNSGARFVHTNTIEGVWGHLKPLGRHVYRGFPRQTLPQYLAEFMFRYNVRCYRTRLSVLSALISRKPHTVLV
jgi:transposase-like protein